MHRYLTKSRFKLSLECATKLFYTDKKEYADQKSTDSFLWELAKGGMQVGELAKFYFSNDVSNITVNTRPYEYDKTIEETKRRLALGPGTVIAEGGFLHANCYVRADIIEVKKEGLYLYEVKAKSWSAETEFTKKNGTPASNWFEYLYDVAFQKWVIEKATGQKVFPRLMLVNKDVVCDVPGLAKHFKIIKKQSGETELEITPGLKKEQLGRELLVKVSVDDICKWIEANPVETELEGTYSFEEYISFVSNHYIDNKKIITPVGSKCSGCEFHTNKDEGSANLKSGMKECWVSQTPLTEKQFDEEDLVLELWSGKGGSPVKKLTDTNIYLLKDSERTHFDSKLTDGIDELTSHQRREIQIQKLRAKDATPHLELNGLKAEMGKWQYPYHFIDFETSAMPMPWHKGVKPYETIAFQFSHHIMQADGSVAHQNQFLDFEPGHFPNFDFADALMKAVGNQGTIFRYHNHENTCLRSIRHQLVKVNEVPGKEMLIDFIDSITQWKVADGKKMQTTAGLRNMVDLYDVVLKYYYSPYAKGSNSLKYILPAVIHDFPILKEKYGKPLYGRKAQIPSLNYESKTWIVEEHNFDPYKTLEPVFEEYQREALDNLVGDLQGLADGGAAMMAYNMLQFSEIPPGQREKIRDALLRYCELDTLAMVILVEGLRSQLK